MNDWALPNANFFLLKNTDNPFEFSNRNFLSRINPQIQGQVGFEKRNEKRNERRIYFYNVGINLGGLINKHLSFYTSVDRNV